jgi:peptidoglycan/LPS O-acetylase OafA/YrhL
MLIQPPEIKQRTPATGWLPAVDGLRAIAIIAVLVHHANTALFTNWALGNVGVAVFFSISGFLAYYVLWRDERRLGRIDYSYFLFRRILRIWPAYFTIILVAYILASTEQRATTSQIPLFTFTINWHQAALLTPQLGTLGILWSIAVEEQFYILAPLMYLGLRSRHWLALSFATIAIANIARFIYVQHFGPQTGNGGLYFITYSYADIFLGGALAAKWFTEDGKISKRVQAWLTAASVTVIIATLRLWGPIVWPPYNLLTLLPYPILAIASPLLLVSLIAPNQTKVSAFLSSAPSSFVGRLSFSLYLVHVLIVTFLRDTLGMTFGGLWFNLWFVVLCLPVAAVLYFAIERPVLRIKERAKPTCIPWPAILIWSAMMFGAIRYFRVA